MPVPSQRNSRRHKLHLAVGFVLMISAGAYSCWLAVESFTTGLAPAFSRDAGTFAKEQSELAFWASIAFHFALGLFLIGFAVSALRRNWPR